MTTILPRTTESRAQIRSSLETSPGENELTKEELSEIYELLAGEHPDEYWTVHRIRREILDELSEHVDTDLSRRSDQHKTHFRQIEIWHLTRTLTEMVGSDGGGRDE